MELWERRRILGQRVAAQRRLYLDLRFWNDLCDAALGSSNDPRSVELLVALRAAVATGKVICPVEFHVVAELYKQRLPEKQAATISLVDELSDRTALVAPPDRVFLEVLRLSQALVAGQKCDSPPLEEMWTRPMYVAGHAMPELQSEGLPPDIIRRVREEIDEEIWELGFVDLIGDFDSFPLGIDDNSKTADLLNRSKRDANTPKFSSLTATYWSEVLGTLDGYVKELGEVWLYLYHRAGGDPSSVSKEDVTTAAVKLKTLLYKVARKTGLKGPLPSAHIGATLFSHIQWDKRRLYKSNDIFDFAHAEAAIPYCNAFATDRSLGALLESSGITKDYQCLVLTDAEGIARWIRDVPGLVT